MTKKDKRVPFTHLAGEPEVITALRPMKEAYERETANNPKRWFASAQSLWSAAELVRHKIRDGDLLSIQGFLEHDETRMSEGDRTHRIYVGPALLLSGYAVENILKAVLVNDMLRKKVLPVPKESDQLDKKLDGHNLVHLSDLVSFPRSKQDTVLLHRLAQFVRWAGRYPVNKSIEWPKNSRSGTSSTDPDDVANLYNRLRLFYERD